MFADEGRVVDGARVHEMQEAEQPAGVGRAMFGLGSAALGFQGVHFGFRVSGVEFGFQTKGERS